LFTTNLLKSYDSRARALESRARAVEGYFFTRILLRSYDSRARAVETHLFTTILLKSYGSRTRAVESRARAVEAHLFTTILLKSYDSRARAVESRARAVLRLPSRVPSFLFLAAVAGQKPLLPSYYLKRQARKIARSSQNLLHRYTVWPSLARNHYYLPTTSSDRRGRSRVVVKIPLHRYTVS
jgi:hypothetical protein